MATMQLPEGKISLDLPGGASSLLLVELDRASVKRKGARVRLTGQPRRDADCSFGNFTDQLSINAWDFCLAAKKTELTRTFTQLDAETKAFSFWLDHQDTFVWNTPNLRRASRKSVSFEDFAESALAGRVGEAITYLTMVKWGYVYWDRCATVWTRAADNRHVNHRNKLKAARFLKKHVKSGRPDLEPDFLFENGAREVALVESKGSFVDADSDNPTAKSDLMHGLAQLDAWSSVISPKPKKSFAIGTYLRDEDDMADPSLIAFVDPPPEGDPGIPVIDIPSDLIRRCNYSAWLAGMGFTEAAIALARNEEMRTNLVALPIVNRAGVDFALVIAGWKLPASKRHGPHFLRWLRHRYPWEVEIDLLDAREILVVGIAARHLESVSQALRNPAGNHLFDMERLEGASFRIDQEGRNWSFMPDGSFIGMIDRDEIRGEGPKMGEFSL